MRKLLSSPVKMALSDAENTIYQNALKYVTELSLNLMAVKVENRPDDFLSWCAELLNLCRDGINYDLLEAEQLRPLKKLQEVLESGVSISQLKMLRIAPWPIFADFIKQQQFHALDERFKLLNYINDLKQTPLAEMIEEDRLAFVGKHTQKHDHSIYNFDVEWFAATKGAKVFQQLVQQSPSLFDQALAHIPLTGDVTFEHYQKFVTDYQTIFQQVGEKAPLAAATRLLAMRRPDQFVALTNAKIEVLCQGLGIAKFDKQDFLSYWQDMIATIRTCAWWHQSEPEQSEEIMLWQNRAILVDVFLYADQSLAQNSNYIKNKERALKPSHSKSNAMSSARKRSTESAEMLVDKALAAEDLPEYLQAKRDSIIKEVKNGKSVEHVIGLMRSIFG